MEPLGARAAKEAKAIAAFLAAEGVPPSARILDVPCGIGRRALALAKDGFEVTAVDDNGPGVEAASRRVPPDLRSRLTFHVSPSESLGPTGETTYDAVLSLDHPLGRHNPSEEIAFLGRLSRRTRPDGCLVLELLHRDFFAGRPRPFAFHVIGTFEQHEFRAFDPVAGVLDLTWKFYERDGPNLRHRMDSGTTLRLFAPHEAARLLEDAGWRVQGVYGGWEREGLSADRRKFVLVARPAART